MKSSTRSRVTSSRVKRAESAAGSSGRARKVRKVLELRLKIDHETFLRGSPDGRERLIVDALGRSVHMVDLVERGEADLEEVWGVMSDSPNPADEHQWHVCFDDSGRFLLKEPIST